MKLVDVVNFSQFYGEVKEQTMPFKTAYKLSKLANTVDENIKFYQDHIKEIIEKYGARDENNNLVPSENGQGVQIDHSKEVECKKEITELQAVEVDLEPNLTLDELDTFTLSPNGIRFAMPFIIE